jgi:hypothetical protein
MATVLGHERAHTERLVSALTERARRRGPALDAGQATLAANLVLGALGGLGQRVVSMSWGGLEPQILGAVLVALLDVATAAGARA